MVKQLEQRHTHTRIQKLLAAQQHYDWKKNGYKPFQAAFSRDEEVDVGAIIGGVFVLVPFLWTMKYKPLRTFELTPEFGVNQSEMSPRISGQNKSKAEKLVALKLLLEEKSITQEEYNKEKKKIEEE